MSGPKAPDPTDRALRGSNRACRARTPRRRIAAALRIAASFKWRLRAFTTRSFDMFHMESAFRSRRSIPRFVYALTGLFVYAETAPSTVQAEAEPPNQLIWAARTCYV